MQSRDSSELLTQTQLIDIREKVLRIEMHVQAVREIQRAHSGSLTQVEWELASIATSLSRAHSLICQMDRRIQTLKTGKKSQHDRRFQIDLSGAALMRIAGGLAIVLGALLGRFTLPQILEAISAMH